MVCKKCPVCKGTKIDAIFYAFDPNLDGKLCTKHAKAIVDKLNKLKKERSK